MIYLDNSATTQVDEVVIQKAAEMMRGQFGNPSSLHFLGAEAYTALGIARNQLAKVLGAHTDRIYFTSGGTESNNLAIQGGLKANRAVGRHIVTTAIEHDSVLMTCRHLETQGYAATYIMPDSQTGRILARDVIDAIREDTTLLSVMAVNNETGELLPLQEIIAGVRKKNPRTLIHCDCVQCFGKLPFKLHVYDVDMLSASAHKLHAPKGVGMLYLKRADMIIPLKFGGSQEGRMNPGTENVPLACAFGVAADQALYDMEERAERVRAVKNHLEKLLKQRLPQAVVNSPETASPYLLNFSIPGFPSHEIVSYLSRQGIYVSAGSACSKGSKSHVLQAMGLDKGRLDSALRISLSKYNTCQEMDKLIAALKEFIVKER